MTIHPLSKASAVTQLADFTDPSVDLVGDTQRLFWRLKRYRSELEAALREKKKNPDFSDIDLDAYFDGV